MVNLHLWWFRLREKMGRQLVIYVHLLVASLVNVSLCFLHAESFHLDLTGAVGHLKMVFWKGITEQLVVDGC